MDSNRRNLLVTLAVVILVLLFAGLMFGRQQTVPTNADGGSTVEEAEQLPAGPANEGIAVDANTTQITNGQ